VVEGALLIALTVAGGAWAAQVRHLLLVAVERAAILRRLAHRAPLAVLAGLAVVATTGTAAGQSSQPEEHRHVLAPIVDRPGRTDPALRERFLQDYAASPARREALQRWLPILGADGILDALEARNAYCHNEGHDLGAEILRRVRDVGAALAACGQRCTTGCTHGVLKEAFLGEEGTPFKHATLADVGRRMREICAGRAAWDVEPGNCAHGVGHALLVLSGGDLGVALGHCRGLGARPLAYYCASGVFMEHATSGAPRPPGASIHHPCDAYPEYAPACYKYTAWRLLQAHGGAVDATAAECLALPTHRRRGCFYGLGSSQLGVLDRSPDRLSRLCGFGDEADRAMCVNGAVEILSVYRPFAAGAACASLDGVLAEACQVAQREGRYGLGKPFHLYFED
jgi:hypothetical protein